jgi:DNA-binding transcriptional regulator YhcF (GntR family)
LGATQKLVSERVLAEQLGLSRGTVKKAYEYLIHQGYAKAVQGAGTFSCLPTTAQNMPRMNQVNQEIDNLISGLLHAGLQTQEVSSLFRLRLLNTEQNNTKVTFAAIDCNIETLRIIRNQLSYLPNLHFMDFLLSDVLVSAHPALVFGEFDIVFSTITHAHELRAVLDISDEQAVKAVVSPDRKTISALASIDDFSRVGVLTSSQRFGQIVQSNLQYFDYRIAEENYVTLDSLSIEALKEFLADKKYIIVPPAFALAPTIEKSAEITDYSNNGGHIINFNYTVERGSIVYVEEKIASILAKRQHS